MVESRPENIFDNFLQTEKEVDYLMCIKVNEFFIKNTAKQNATFIMISNSGYQTRKLIIQANLEQNKNPWQNQFKTANSK